MGERPLLIAAERLFEAMGLPPGEAHICQSVMHGKRGYRLQRRFQENGRPKTCDMTSVHHNKQSLWQSIDDMRFAFNKIATGICNDLDFHETGNPFSIRD